MKTNNIIFIGTITLIIVLNLAIFIFNLTYTEKKPSSLQINYNLSKVNDCRNLSLENTSICLRDEVSNFYNYNLSNLNKDMNLLELKEIGGVCWHYADFYKENLDNLGFYTIDIIPKGDDVSHKLTFTWTKNLSGGTYCLIDQLDVYCSDLEEVNMNLYNELTK